MDETTTTTPTPAEIGAQTTQPDAEQKDREKQAKTPDGSDREEAFKFRLTREMEKARKQWEQEFAAKLEEEKKKAKMDAVERLELEKSQLMTQLEQLKQQSAMADAKAELLQAGVDPSKANKALKVYLAELQELGDKTEAPSFEAFLDAWPEFKAKPTTTPDNRPNPQTGANTPPAGKVGPATLEEALKKSLFKR